MGNSRQPKPARYTEIRKVIRSARSAAAAPFIAGGYGAATQISTGKYSSALLCMAVGALSGLIMIMALMLAELFADFMDKR